MNSIYRFVNNINGHMYIGLSTDPMRRYNDHILASNNPNHVEYNYPIHKAIRKYGIRNFTFEILEDNIKDLETMKERERYWIQYYDTYNNREHYNQTPGGDAVGEKNIHLGQDHGMAILTEDEVIFCRKCYQAGERSRDIYDKYFSEKLTYSGFLGMWHGKTWKHIMPEIFETNPHPSSYTSADRDIIVALYKESNLPISQFVKTDECYVGYGTLWNMVHNPTFYDNK